MAGTLSPDGNYYWDGVRWARAVTPDGAWRWDGSAWRPAAATRTSRRTVEPIAVVLALAIICVLIVGGVGVWLGPRLISGAQPPKLQSSVSPASTACGRAGASLHEGDMLCGRRLGAPVASLDCTTDSQLPLELQAEHIAAASNDWTPVDVSIDKTGCQLFAERQEIVGIDSVNMAAPDLTLVADLVPVDFIGSISLRVACTSSGCLDFVIYSDETFELDEGTPDGGWSELTAGSLERGQFHQTGANRIILRFAEGVATVYLNGHEVTQATPDITQQTGFFGFYAENEVSPEKEHVQLRTLYAFES